jgi:hypothetical protein
MRRVRSGVLALGAAVLLAAWATPVQAAKIDNKLAAILGKDIINAAHPTAKNPKLVKWNTKKDDNNRLMLNLEMTYDGAISKTTYKAKITVTIDATKEPPTVLDLKYTDDNRIPASKKKLKAVQTEVAKKLPKKL